MGFSTTQTQVRSRSAVLIAILLVAISHPYPTGSRQKKEDEAQKMFDVVRDGLARGHLIVRLYQVPPQGGLFFHPLILKTVEDKDPRYNSSYFDTETGLVVHLRREQMSVVLEKVLAINVDWTQTPKMRRLGPEPPIVPDPRGLQIAIIDGDRAYVSYLRKEHVCSELARLTESLQDSAVKCPLVRYRVGIECEPETKYRQCKDPKPKGG